MRRFNNFGLLFFILLTLVSTAQKKVRSPDYLMRLDSKQDFDLLKGEPLSKNFNGIECVKVVYVMQTKKLFYLESKRYKWHYTFITDVLGDHQDLSTFNELNYQPQHRDYILATFNYNVNTKNYFLQFASCDNPSDQQIDILVQKIAATFFKQNQFKILLNSTILLRRKKEISLKHATISSDELFKNQNFQSICKGKTTGILKYIHADSIKEGRNYANYILVLHGSSNQLPLCKGLITNEFQTPLSHICLLTNNRHTPCAAQKNIFNIDSLKKLNNQLVELIVTESSASIRSAAFSKDNKPVKSLPKIKLKADTQLTTITDLTALSYKNKIAYGSKVCNLAELKKVKHNGGFVNTPKNAFAIPFHYYHKHIMHGKAGNLINELLRDNLTLNNDSLLAKKLSAIRKAIRKQPLNKEFLNAVTQMCQQRFAKNKVRFRSSSNCEDEANFNGAGLYTSQTGIVGDTSKSIESAIKKVWASLWSLRAFKERSFFNFDHTGVTMGVLVHAAFDNEEINGVAITKNLYRDYDFGFVINMQKGEEEVVSPKAGVTCEQLISYMNNQGIELYDTSEAADWISFSSLHSNSSLMSGDELKEFTLQLESIKNHFFNAYKLWGKMSYKDFALDVEFKVILNSDHKREFLFKQARPYNN
ncbi:MAG: hypothetical protein IT236_07800 [Bacteroidia bacterium]|nr:hypothetical protein [Bacteroidia bacterium]